MPEERTTLRVPLEEAEEKIQRQLEAGNTIATVDILTVGVLNDRKAEWRTWREYTEALLEHLFSNKEAWRGFRGRGARGPLAPRPVHKDAESFRKDVRSFRENCQEDLRKLWSIREKLEFYVGATIPGSRHDAARAPVRRRVFVVHGRDAGAESAVALLIRKVGLEPVILHELPSRGSRPLLDKLIAGGESAEYAVVVMTADDVGALATEKESLRPRARQNVVLELGYFLGLLGPARVCALTQGGIEAPSDYNGIAYIPYDDSGAWRYALAKELREIWDDIDLNTV